MTVRVSDVASAVETLAPSAWAEPWDRVGLLAGDPAAEVSRVFVTLDPTPDALGRCVEAGASVLLTHHPAYLESAPLLPADGLAGVPFSAVSRGVALIAAHTNLDRAPEGADALPLACGLRVVGPLESATQTVETVVTYVPAGAEEAVRRALAAAGAGRIGRYAGCSFTSEGTGRYTPLAGSTPAGGSPGVEAAKDEVRVECVCEPGAGERMAAAVRDAHPYEEPLIVVGVAAIERGVARMGRVCETADACTVAELAASVGRSLGSRPTAWGDGERRVRVVATAPGSGRSLVSAAHAARADVLLTGELRYHEALDAAASGLCVIEAGHDATEWPMVPVLARAAMGAGLAAADVIVDPARVNWWIAEGA